MKQIGRLIQLLICVVVLAVAGLQHSGRLLGYDITQQSKAQSNGEQPKVEVRNEHGSTILSTEGLATDVKGYGGQVPLSITLTDGKIASVEALPNHETPDFFQAASVLLTKWNGLTPEQAIELKVDAVSGATFSSRAIIENAQRGMHYLAQHPETQQDNSWWKGFAHLPLVVICGLVVALMGAIVPLLTHNRRYRMLQLALNVVVLGLWCGTFLSYSTLLSLVENGWNGWLSLLPAVVVGVALSYPLFGRKQHYCTNICPFGSAQELCGRINKRKWKVSPTLAHRLSTCRDLLWAVLTLLMLAGISFRWMDYELFTAFIFRSTSVVVIVLAVLTLLLSVFITRPYCRFVCPTGTLLKIVEDN